MSSCNISIKNTTNDRVYLKGRVTGLNSSKMYCMAFRVWSGTTNLPSKNLNYTYFGNTSSFNLSNAGCYLPLSDLGGKKTIDILCHEVSGNCETIVKFVCRKTINVEDQGAPTPTFDYVTFYVSDDQPRAKRGVTITVAGTSIVTDASGKAKIYVQLGKSYTAKALTPSGHNPVFVSKTFIPTGSMTIPLKFERITVPPGNGNGNGDTRHTVTFFVKDQDGLPVDRAGIKTDGVYQCYTGSDGKCTMRPENTSSGGHKAILTVLPDGYVKTRNTVKIFFHEPGNFITYTCKRKTILPPGNGNGNGDDPGNGNGNGDDNGTPPYTPPSGANKQFVIGLKPLSWANRGALQSMLPRIVDVIAKNLANFSSRYEVIGSAQLVGNDIIVNIRRT